MHLGSTLFYLGEFAPAREHLEQGIALYDPQKHDPLAFRLRQDPGVACLLLCGLGPVVSWLSRPGPEEEPGGADPSPGAVSPL